MLPAKQQQHLPHHQPDKTFYLLKMHIHIYARIETENKSNRERKRKRENKRETISKDA